jgi:hypothetical protein
MVGIDIMPVRSQVLTLYKLNPPKHHSRQGVSLPRCSHAIHVDISNHASASTWQPPLSVGMSRMWVIYAKGGGGRCEVHLPQ